MNEINLEHCIECLEQGRSFGGSREQVYRAMQQVARDGKEQLLERFLDAYATWRAQDKTGSDRTDALVSAYTYMAVGAQLCGAYFGDSPNSQPVRMLRGIYERRGMPVFRMLTIHGVTDPN